jgi:hypothetical protein
MISVYKRVYSCALTNVIIYIEYVKRMNFNLS